MKLRKKYPFKSFNGLAQELATWEERLDLIYSGDFEHEVANWGFDKQELSAESVKESVETRVFKLLEASECKEYLAWKELHELSQLYKIQSSVESPPEKSLTEEYASLFGHLAEEARLLKSQGVEYRQVVAQVWQNYERTEVCRMREILCQLGLSQMLLEEDWKVDRPDGDISEILGIQSYAALETELLKAYEKHQLVSQDPVSSATGQAQKLVHFELGPGNGQTMESRRYETSQPFGTAPLNDYWTQLGYADRLYYTLPDLLRSFVLPEYENNQSLKEFIQILSVLIIREANTDSARKGSSEAASAKKRDFHARIRKLPKKINDLKVILQQLNKYFSPSYLKRLKTIETTGEFPEDKEEVPISTECRSLIKEMVDSKGKDFWRKYFNQQLFDRKFPLASRINIHPYNIIIAKFQDLERTVPEKETFSLVTDCRSLSHLENEAYKQCLRQIFRRLTPGGVSLGDGVTESYTRDVRIRELEEIQQEFGRACSIHLIIGEDKKIKSVILQKNISDGAGFIPPLNAEAFKNIGKGTSLVSLSDLPPLKRSVLYFRSYLIALLKERYVLSEYDRTDQEHDQIVYNGRMTFRNLRIVIRSLVREYQDQISEIIGKKGVDLEAMKQLANTALNKHTDVLLQQPNPVPISD